jgi:predicted amidohydrolase YtcJ
LLATALLLVPVACSQRSRHEAADGPVPEIVFSGGTIYTLAQDSPSAVQALAVQGGAVVATGTREEVLALCGPQTRQVDLQGGFAVPGLVDAHAHLFSLGPLLDQANLLGTTSPEECVEIARAKAEELPAGAWLRGRGWDQNDWAHTTFPDRRLLDEAFGDRPVYLRRVDGHASWVNSAALRRAGFSADSPDPPGGQLLRDPRSGELTGILIDAADDSLRNVIPPATESQRLGQLRRAVEEAAAAGLTGVHELGVSLENLSALLQAEREGWLPLRVVAYLGGEEALSRHEGGPWRPAASALVRLEGVKLYADGALGSRGAALLRDYTDRPGHRGLLQASEAALTAQVTAAFARGFGVAIHAIGDRGNRTALDAIERGHRESRRQDPNLPALPEMRARIEHAQVLDPQDVPRFRALGVIPSMQPTHCTSDMPWAPRRLGAERLGGAYAWRTLRDDGNIIPLGSDFPVEAVSPLLGLYAARTRQTPAGEPAGGWSPEQRLGRMESLLGFTTWPAQACGMQQEWGRLLPGYRADLTILDRDPLAADAEELLAARILATVVEGEVRYRSAARPGLLD